jgi:hypothetical protein
MAATNQATNNICDRTITPQLGATYDDSLVFRFWNGQLEQGIIHYGQSRHPAKIAKKKVNRPATRVMTLTSSEVIRPVVILTQRER